MFLEGQRTVPLEKFHVVGMMAHPAFQKCRFLVNKLHACFPKVYQEPEVRAMLNVDWDEYLTKMKRRHGKQFYLLKKPVVVYHNGTFLGDDVDLKKLVGQKYAIETNLDFHEICNEELVNYFTHVMEKLKRKFVFFTIAISEHVVGALLFQLYNDLVPLASENFIARCISKKPGHTYVGTRIHRIAHTSWIQCGGFRLKHEKKMPCENYVIGHDKRGVLSMCNEKRHVDNTTQFFVTLEKTPWMDYKYVAFGQLVQGAEVLNLIEKVSTYYQNPTTKIEIVDCGEFTLCSKPYNEEVFITSTYPEDLEALIFGKPTAELKRDPDSELTIGGYKSKKYFLTTDVRSYMPFKRYSQMFEEYLRALEMRNKDDVEQHFEAMLEESETEGNQEDGKVDGGYDMKKRRSSSFNEFIREVTMSSVRFYFYKDHLIL